MNLATAKKPLLVLGGALTGMTAAYVLTKPKLRRGLARGAQHAATPKAATP